MSDSTARATSEARPEQAPATPQPTRPGRQSMMPAGPSQGGASLTSDRGITKISDIVVAKIAALATREIAGVQAMGTGMARTFGAIRARVPGGSEGSITQGVAVEVGERQAAVDIDIVTYYGQSIVEVTEAVRANVISRIESMTGLEVVEVNIAVDDLYIEAEAGRERDVSRVE
jgi:uncharacterized alkaline shock family protein YloU